MNVFHRYNFTVVQVPTQLTGLKKRRNKTKILSSFVAAHDRRTEGSDEVEGWARRSFTSMEKIKVVCKRRWLNLQIVSRSSTGQLNKCIWMLLPSREGLTVVCVSELDGLQLLMVNTRKWSIRSQAGGLRVFVNSRLQSYNEHWRFASSVLVVAAPALRIFTFLLLL